MEKPKRDIYGLGFKCAECGEIRGPRFLPYTVWVVSGFLHCSKKCAEITARRLEDRPPSGP